MYCLNALKSHYYDILYEMGGEHFLLNGLPYLPIESNRDFNHFYDLSILTCCSNYSKCFTILYWCKQ